MVDLVVLQSVSYVAAAIGVLIAAVFYVMTIRVTQRNMRMTIETRQTQLFMQFYYKTSTAEYWDDINEILEKWSWTDFDDFMKKYGPEENPKAWRRYNMVYAPWEHMGLLVRDELIDPKLIYDWLGSLPIRLWEKLEPILIRYREELEAPPKGMQWEWFEDLYYVLKDVREKDVKDLDDRIARRKMQRKALGLPH